VIFWVGFKYSQEPNTGEDGGKQRTDPTTASACGGDNRSGGYRREGVRVSAQVHLHGELGFCRWDGLCRRDGDTGRLWKGN
jgi:hypothetical protein